MSFTRHIITLLGLAWATNLLGGRARMLVLTWVLVLSAAESKAHPTVHGSRPPRGVWALDSILKCLVGGIFKQPKFDSPTTMNLIPHGPCPRSLRGEERKRNQSPRELLSTFGRWASNPRAPLAKDSRSREKYVVPDRNSFTGSFFAMLENQILEYDII